jgi:hypothetical protein
MLLWWVIGNWRLASLTTSSACSPWWIERCLNEIEPLLLQLRGWPTDPWYGIRESEENHVRLASPEWVEQTAFLSKNWVTKQVGSNRFTKGIGIRRLRLLRRFGKRKVGSHNLQFEDDSKPNVEPFKTGHRYRDLINLWSVDTSLRV